MSQVDAVGATPVKTWADYEDGCMNTYRGGYSESRDLQAFRHGMQTVFSLLRAEFPPAEQCKAAPDLLAACIAADEDLSRSDTVSAANWARLRDAVYKATASTEEAGMRLMTVEYFDTLSRRDFDNGAVRDEIRGTLQDRERLLADCEECQRHHAARIAELERLHLEAQNRIGDLADIIGNIEQCRCVEADSITILCDNPEADDIEKQSAVEAVGDYTGYEPERFYGRTWDEALKKAADCARRHYSENEDDQ